MNAKERKKEKRRAERAALQTTMATKDAALDAATSSAKESQTPEAADEAESPTSTTTEDEWAAIMLQMPQHFAAVVAQRLEGNGHAPTTHEEWKMLEEMLGNILPSIEDGVLEMRRQAQAGLAVTGAEVDVEFDIITTFRIGGAVEGADT